MRLSQKYLLLLFNVISCLMIVVFALILFQQSRTGKNYGEWVRHTYQVLNVSNQVMHDVAEIESSYRGYFLTGVDSFLAKIPATRDHLIRNIAYLQEIAARDPGQNHNAAVIQSEFQLFSRLLEQQQETYRLYGSSGLIVDDINASRRAMTDLQNGLDAFIEAESVKLNHRLWLENAEHRNQVWTIVTGAGVAILVLIISNALISNLIFSGASTSERLEKMREAYELIQDNVNDGIYDYNLESGKVSYSQSYWRQLGYSPETDHHFENGFLQFLHPDDRDAVKNNIEDFKRNAGTTYHHIYRMKHRDGSWLWMLSRAVATRNAQGRLMRMVGVHTDITAQKKQEMALRELNDEMESFTYIASHDLRSPLVNIKGFAKEIENSINGLRLKLEDAAGRLTPKENAAIAETFERDVPESLGFINSAVERMDNLTGAILNLSRIGRRAYKVETVDVSNVVARCIGALAYEINTNQTRVAVDELPSVEADELAVEQIFSNILENAIKYLVTDRKGKITVTGTMQKDEVIYTIADNGRGIDENDQQRVFSIFRRARNAADVRGVGMGLAFVKATVRKMGGRIWYESVLGQGTSFNVALPQRTIKGKDYASE